MKNILLILVAALSSCLKMDPMLYNNDNTITEYQLDDYSGDQDFILNSDFDIPKDRISLFTLQSKTETESDYTNIQAIYIGDVNRIRTDTVILYCHGTRWHMDFYWQRAKLLAHTNGKNRYGVLMMDYRGYGLSDGKPTEEGLYADVDACIQWLRSKGLTQDRLIIYGFSLGSAPACKLTATPKSLKPSKLILESPFASASVLVQDASQLNMPANYFTDLKIENAEEIKKINEPFLWIHGVNDSYIGCKTHGEVVFKNYQGSYSTKFLTEGADHSDVPDKMGFDVYLKVIGDFIRKR